MCKKEKKHDIKVKRCTGFPSEASILAYIFIVCNGNKENIIKRNSVLTWYEEWFCYFEILWGRTSTRWEDVSADYGVFQKDLRKIMDQKMDIVSDAMKMMPAYATFEEDKHFSDDKYKRRYVNLRPVFWDMTNLKIPKPSNAESKARWGGETYSFPTLNFY